MHSCFHTLAHLFFGLILLRFHYVSEVFFLFLRFRLEDSQYLSSSLLNLEKPEGVLHQLNLRKGYLVMID